MAGINKVIIIGRLTKDPDIKDFGNGNKIANIDVATSETWKDKTSGERKEKVEYHKVSIQKTGAANLIESFLKKGQRIYVEGKLQTRKWQDKNGQDRYTTEVVVSFDGRIELFDYNQERKSSAQILDDTIEKMPWEV